MSSVELPDPVVPGDTLDQQSRHPTHQLLPSHQLVPTDQILENGSPPSKLQSFRGSQIANFCSHAGRPSKRVINDAINGRKLAWRPMPSAECQ